MTKFALPKIKPLSAQSSTWLLVIIFFAVIIGLVLLNEANNRNSAAQDKLTLKDFVTCGNDIGTTQFESCWNYLHGEGASKKDLSDLNGVDGQAFYGAPTQKQNTFWSDAIAGITKIFSGGS